MDKASYLLRVRIYASILNLTISLNQYCNKRGVHIRDDGTLYLSPSVVPESRSDIRDLKVEVRNLLLRHHQFGDGDLHGNRARVTADFHFKHSAWLGFGNHVQRFRCAFQSDAVDRHDDIARLKAGNGGGGVLGNSFNLNAWATA